MLMVHRDTQFLTVHNVRQNVARQYDKKDEKTSTGCRKGGGSMFLCLRVNGETKKLTFCQLFIFLFLRLRKQIVGLFRNKTRVLVAI
jgi:hypothetical protein